MPLLEWSEDLTCYIGEIDDQHKRLLEILNELHKAMIMGRGQKVLREIIDELADYTLYHFSTEERYMKIGPYPELEKHLQEHSEFIAQISKFKAQYEQGKLGLSIKVLRFLSQWLSCHIKVSDKSIGLFIIQSEMA